MAEFQARPPDYKVWAVNASTEEKGTIGVAWKQDDGSITVKINAFVNLAGVTKITLYPEDKNKVPFSRAKKNRPEQAASETAGSESNYEDTPF